MSHKMNFKKSVKNDVPLGIPAIIMAVGIVLMIVAAIESVTSSGLSFNDSLRNFGDTFNVAQLALYSAIVLVGLFLFIKRIRYIKSFETEDKTVDAKVTDIRYVKDRCRVDVEFSLHGEACKKRFRLFNNKQTKYVHMDSEVKLLVKDDDPKKTLIAELYFD